MPLRETWESDGNQGWKDGVPGRKKEIREIKKALPGTRMGVSRKNREEEQKIRG